MITNFLVTVTVQVDLNGVTPEDIRQHMEDSFRMAIANGALTGYTEAEVDSYDLKAQVL